MDFVFLLRQTARQQSDYVFGSASTQMRKQQQDFCSSRHHSPSPDVSERETILAQS
jgi:hypothetical protein